MGPGDIKSGNPQGIFIRFSRLMIKFYNSKLLLTKSPLQVLY